MFYELHIAPGHEYYICKPYFHLDGIDGYWITKRGFEAGELPLLGSGSFDAKSITLYRRIEDKELIRRLEECFEMKEES